MARLRPSTLARVLAPGPGAPPLEEVAAALAGRPGALQAIAHALPPARGERLLRLSQRPRHSGAGPAVGAGERLVRGLFWPLVYELRPELWDRLAGFERPAPALLAALPADGALVLDVGAGTGRLAAALVARARLVVALEPAPALRRAMRARHPGLVVVAGTAAHLPFAAGSFGLVTSCGALGPHPPAGGKAARLELERCAARPGMVALAAPEDPGWWQAHGYRRHDFPAPLPAPAPDPELLVFFGPPDPPSILLVKRL